MGIRLPACQWQVLAALCWPSEGFLQTGFGSICAEPLLWYMACATSSVSLTCQLCCVLSEVMRAGASLKSSKAQGVEGAHASTTAYRLVTGAPGLCTVACVYVQS